MVLTGRTLLAGAARGPVAALAPLSFWGGFDPGTGLVTDPTHPAFGRSLSGCVLVMSASRGSSSSASVLAEAIRLGTAPAAIVLSEADPILLAGAMVAAELYGRACPVVLLGVEDHARAAGEGFAEVAAGAEGAVVRIWPPGESRPAASRSDSADSRG